MQARRGRVAPLSGRPLETAGNRRRRWMTVPARKGGTELGLQTVSLALLCPDLRLAARGQSESGRKMPW